MPSVSIFEDMLGNHVSTMISLLNFLILDAYNQYTSHLISSSIATRVLQDLRKRGNLAVNK